jgi:hypothetical protein
MSLSFLPFESDCYLGLFEDLYSSGMENACHIHRIAFFRLDMALGTSRSTVELVPPQPEQAAESSQSPVSEESSRTS